MDAVNTDPTTNTQTHAQIEKTKQDLRSRIIRDQMMVSKTGPKIKQLDADCKGAILARAKGEQACVDFAQRQGIDLMKYDTQDIKPNGEPETRGPMLQRLDAWWNRQHQQKATYAADVAKAKKRMLSDHTKYAALGMPNFDPEIFKQQRQHDIKTTRDSVPHLKEADIAATKLANSAQRNPNLDGPSLQNTMTSLRKNS